MQFIKKNILRVALLFMGMMLSVDIYAEDTATKTVTSSNNQLSTLMIVIALLLAFVIWGMGQVLVTMGKQALDKSKHQSRSLPLIILAFFSLLSATATAEDAAAEKINVMPNYGGMDSTAFWILATVIFTEIVVIVFMMFSIRRIQVELLPKTEKEKIRTLKNLWARMDKKLFTKAVAVEKETDILLDHDYDGIKELDNALPPWWKYGFIVTVVIGFVYLLNFHVLGYGKNPTEEYQEEIVKAQEAKELYEAKNADKIDESNLKMPEIAGINAGKEIFTTVCWACHGKQGEGGAGPNLTDNYWLHKGSLSDIYQSIKHGYPDKGMQGWEKNYSPKEINELAGFIKTLVGTNPPNSKVPQGDIYTEEPVTDSIAIKNTVMVESGNDSTKTVKK